ncbi:MAG: LysR family transcriptional regulator [Neomegalonema sp.]|nr:LysR family transcriptional regulator [Neomegalonema sp.]
MNRDRLKSLSIFAEIVQAGSVRGAARKLSMTPSAISYHLHALEEEIGAPLLYRSTRRLSMTDAGGRLYHAALAMLEAAEAGLRSATQPNAELQGRFRVTLNSALIQSFIAEALVRFHRDFPLVELELDYSDAIIDLVGERYDLALRSGRMENSSLKCRMIWRMPRRLVASPEFLERVDPIAHAADLGSVPWIKFAKMSPERRLIDPEGREWIAQQAGGLTVNSIEAMIDLTRLGAAISSPPTHLITRDIETERLIPVLAGWTMPPVPTYAVWPAVGVENPMTARFLKYLTEEPPRRS